MTRPRKNASSKRCVFSSASTIEKRGSAPKSSAASPWATCRSAKSVCEGATFASAVATFTAVVVVPTPPLAPTNANTSPLLPPATRDARRGARSPARAPSGVIGSCRNSVAPARIASSRTVGSDSEATTRNPTSRVLALHRRHRRRDGARAARVHDDDVRRLGRRVRQSSQLGRAPPRRAHAARAQELLQLAIERIDDENFRNQTCSHLCIAHRTNNTFRRNEAVSSTVLVPPCQAGNRDEPADDVLVTRSAHALDEEAHDVRDGHARLSVRRAGEERVDVEQRHRHDSGAPRVILAVGADAGRAASLNRLGGAVPGGAGILLRESHPARPAALDTLLGRADHVPLLGAHGQRVADLEDRAVAVLDVVPVIRRRPDRWTRLSFGRSSARNQPDERRFSEAADLERHLQTVVGRRVAIGIERCEAGARIGSRLARCRRRALSQRDRVHSRRPASCTCRRPNRASTGRCSPRRPPSSRPICPRPPTASCTPRHCPVITCAVAVARTSWLVMPMIWAKNVGSAFERRGAAVDVRANAGVGQTRRARRARNRAARRLQE